jgi:hypothetical protein
MSDSEKSKRIIVSAMMLAMEKGVDPDLFAWCLLQTAALGYKESHGEEWVEEFAEACGATVERLQVKGEEE